MAKKSKPTAETSPKTIGEEIVDGLGEFVQDPQHPRDKAKQFTKSLPDYNAPRYCIGGPLNGKIEAEQPEDYNGSQICDDGGTPSYKFVWAWKELEINQVVTLSFKCWELIP